MVWGDIMTSFWPMCVITSAIARFIPIFKLEYFWNAKTYTGEILIWCHIDCVLSEKPQNTHNLNCLFFNGCLGWKFKKCWNDCIDCIWRNMPAGGLWAVQQTQFARSASAQRPWAGILGHIQSIPFLLAHLSRRLEWAIVIAHRPSVRPSSVRPA